MVPSSVRKKAAILQWNEALIFHIVLVFISTFTGIFNREKQDTKSMDVDFVIPLSKDDLLSGEAGCYVVDEVLSARVLPNKLRG